MSDTDATEAPDEASAREVNPKNAWTIKGMPADRREAIIRASRRNAQSVAEFVWSACDARIRADREPLRANGPTGPDTTEIALPVVATGQPGANLAELVGLALQAVATKPEPGNRALLGQVRGLLRERIAAVRALPSPVDR